MRAAIVRKAKAATAQIYQETPAALAKVTEMAQAGKADEEKRQAEDQLTKALAYNVPTGHGLPSEGQTYGQVLEASRTVGLQLLKIIAGRAEASAMKFTPNTPAEKSARAAAIYILDHQPTEQATQ